MGKERTDARPYPSKYAPGEWVTAAQWLAELMCERQAARKKTALPLRFWNTHPEWAKVLRHQLKWANGLFKRFEAAAVGRALRTPRGKKVFSLAAEWFLDLCKAEQEKLGREKSLAERVEPLPPPAPAADARKAPRFVIRKSILSILKDVRRGEDKSEGGKAGRG